MAGSESKKLGKPSPTVYVEGATTDGKTVVGLWNLHVRIMQDQGSWFAQAYEIDFAAQGSSLADVKHRFEAGLAATFHEYLTIYGTAARILKPAPAEAWQELQALPGSRHGYSSVSVHELFADEELSKSFPFAGIEYFGTEAASAAC